MLTGKKLGEAIEAARLRKGVTKKAIADHFEVAPPSIQDWVNRGTIDKEKLPGLWAYFVDVAGPEHWGLKAFPWTTGQISTDEPTLDQALEVVGIALAQADKSVREALAANLGGWARDGGADHWRQALTALLNQARLKRPGT